MPRSIFRHLRLLAFGLALLTAPSVVAQDVDGARTFLQELADQALAVLARDDISDEEAIGSAKDLLREGFDLPTIGRFVIGRYWNAATPEQQREYMDLFEQVVLETYTSRFNEYDGSSFSVVETRPLNERDVLVSSVLDRPGAPPLGITWRVRDRGEGFQIIDVSVEGVSMAITQRNEFASVIQRSGGNFSALLDALRQRTG